MIGIIAALLPKARIDVVTTKLSVLRERIYPELQHMVGDVGLVCTGKNIRNKRVMCWSARSLHKAEADADIVFGDECHELAADSFSCPASSLAKFRTLGCRFAQYALRRQRSQNAWSVWGAYYLQGQLL